MKITLKNISLGYKNRELISDANTIFNQGSLIALLGRNGTGKSTLLRAMSGLSKPNKGEILLDNYDISSLDSTEIAKKISFVTTDKVRITNLSCQELVALGRVPYTNWLGRIQVQDQEIIDKSLELVGLRDFKDKAINKISDGERQRAMIARALAQDTPIILLDEPTAFLDLPNKYEICKILKNLAQNQGKTIIFSTHDLDVAMQCADSLAIIDSPKILQGTPSQVKEDGTLQRLFMINSFI